MADKLAQKLWMLTMNKATHKRKEDMHQWQKQTVHLLILDSN